MLSDWTTLRKLIFLYALRKGANSDDIEPKEPEKSANKTKNERADNRQKG